MAVPQEYREIMLQPGEFYFGEASTRIRTLLGSCVAITAWHPTLHVGGMCHYLLATREGHAEHELDGRYGDEALQLFLREMTARGTHPKDYQIKLFGGGDMFPSLEKRKHAMEIGARNIALAQTAIESLGATVMAQDVGDTGHRSIIFDVWSGDVWVKHQRTAGVAEPDRRETVSSKKPIQVLVVDDSATVRQVLAGLLSKEPDIQVMAVASDPIVALEHMKKQWPDVITLDIEMPRMDGITFLKHVMATRPTPVVICSSLTEQGAAITIQALAAGALSIITKPKVGLREFLEESSIQLVDAVKAAAQSNMQSVALNTPRTGPPVQKFTADVMLAAPTRIMASTTARIVVVGTSTGGTQALESVLTALSRSAPGIVIVQHMPETFTAAFAERLNSLCQIDVREAKTGDRVVQGQALVAPGGRHLLLNRDGAHYCVEVVDGPLVNRHRPSVDVLFRSVAKCAGGNALGIIMTGMGDDGAAGLLEMRKAGAKTIGQNESTCVVYGMPKEAMKRGATEREVPLSAIAPEILAFR